MTLMTRIECFSEIRTCAGGKDSEPGLWINWPPIGLQIPIDNFIQGAITADRNHLAHAHFQRTARFASSVSGTRRQMLAEF
jgi:hypothetical protein